MKPFRPKLSRQALYGVILGAGVVIIAALAFILTVLLGGRDAPAVAATSWPTLGPPTPEQTVETDNQDELGQDQPGPTSSAPTAILGPTTLPGSAPTVAGDPTATPFPTPLVGNALADYTVDALSRRSYDGGTIVREGVVVETDAYTQIAIAYTTDGGLRVTGLVNVPDGEGPWPVLILLHGGIDQSVYQPGDGTRGHADFFARQGYLTIAPDYRTYNDTGGSGSPLKIPWSIDVLNLMAALPTLSEADADNVGVLGHSRGGGVASYLVVLSPVLPQLKAVSLYAPLSFDQAVNYVRYRDFFGAEWPANDAAIYGTPESNPRGYAAVSPINYLDRVTVPVEIHHGDADDALPVEWSRDLAERLRELGKDVTYYEYPGAAHTFAGADYALFLERNLEFFDARLK